MTQNNHSCKAAEEIAALGLLFLVQKAEVKLDCRDF